MSDEQQMAAELTTLRKELAKTYQHNRWLHDQLTTLRAERVNSNEALKRENAELREELEKTSGGFEARIETRRQLREQRDDAWATIASLQAQLDTRIDAGAELRAELERTEIALSKAQREVDTANAELQHAQQRQDALQVQLDYISSELERKTVELETALAENRIDGELLADLIIAACPAILTDETARRVAEVTIEELASIGPGVKVFRGRREVPWGAFTPLARHAETEDDAKLHTDGCGLPPVALPDPGVMHDLQWSVFTGPSPSERPVHLADAADYAAAEMIANHVPGAWVWPKAARSPAREMT